MEKNKTRNSSCCSCEADFKNEVDQIVKEGEAPTAKEHKQKEEELREAFSQDKK